MSPRTNTPVGTGKSRSWKAKTDSAGPKRRSGSRSAALSSPPVDMCRAPYCARRTAYVR